MTSIERYVGQLTFINPWRRLRVTVHERVSFIGIYLHSSTISLDEPILDWQGS